MKLIRSLTPTIAAVVVSSVLAVGGGAYAAGALITSEQIRDGAVHTQDLADNAVTSRKLENHSVNMWDLSDSAVDGLKGKDGVDGLAGAVYRIAHYDNGGGGISTVACADDNETSQQFTAISGGANVEVPDAGTATEPITASFPGRMDWSTNTPKPGRLDGWVVKFGNGAGPSAGSGTLEIWALCVPNTSISTETTHY